MTMWLLFAPTAALADDCATRPSAQELTAVLDQAEAAYAALDADGFEVATGAADRMLRCLGEPAAPRLAAHVHRVQGIRRFSERDRLGAVAAFAAARAADPDANLSVAVAPPGNALRTAWDAAAPAGARTDLPDPAAGTLLVDGVPAQSRAADRPSLVQVVAEDGTLLSTAWLLPGEAPPYVSAAAPPSAPPPIPLPVAPVAPRRPVVDPVLAWVAGGAALSAAALYAGATAERAEFDAGVADYRPDEELAGHQTAANALVVGSAGAGAAAVGLALASFVVVKF